MRWRGEAVAVAAYDGQVRERAVELRRHAGARFDGGDPGTAFVEEPGGDARAGADVDGAGAAQGRWASSSTASKSAGG